MFKVGDIEINKALLLAPMEDVTDISFRLLCKQFGADVVYTEFVNSEGLIRSVKNTIHKMEIANEERPVGIQIYGENIESMVKAAIIAEERNPDMIDVNAGCWVKKVANRGAGAGLLKDPPYLQKMIEEIVKSVKIPVTVKTRIGWDKDSVQIEEIAKRVEDAGAQAITLHCRTRSMGHSGDPEWHWINKIKNIVSIPVVLNGGVFSPEDAARALNETNADGIMIARGAIGQPWIFRQAQELIHSGKVTTEITPELRIHTALKHLKDSMTVKGDLRAIYEFRKYYSGYLKGLYNVSEIRRILMTIVDYSGIEEILLNYLQFLKDHENSGLAV